MGKKILCIDDKQEELVHAAVAVRTAGKHYDFQMRLVDGENMELAQMLTDIEQADAVITDLHFPCGEHLDELPPAGLLVVIHAIAHNVPVVICTDGVTKGGHHGKTLSWVFSYVCRSKVFGSSCPFEWEETKDWALALEFAERLIAEKEERL